MKKQLSWVAFGAILLIMNSCSVNPESLAKKATAEAEKQSMEHFSPLAEYDTPIPAGDLPRLNYELQQARGYAANELGKKFDPDYDGIRVSIEDPKKREEYDVLYEQVMNRIDSHYAPQIEEAMRDIVGNYVLCFCENGLTDTEAVIERISGSPNSIRIRVEGTLTQRATTMHYRYDNALTGKTSIGAVKLFRVDNNSARILSLPGERVRAYVLLHRWPEQLISALTITDVRY